MDDHSKKKIAPVVITILMIIYYVVYFGVIIAALSGVFKYLLGVVPLIFGVVMICVCKERMDEIDGGEEDDLSKY